MYKLFLICAAIAVSGCSGSGVGSGAGGAPGTDTGTTGLVVFATIAPSGASIDAGICNEAIGTTVDTRTITITVQDKSANPLFQQGVTFNGYTVRYSPTTGGAPPLSTRTFYSTIPIPLNGQTQAVASQSIVLVDATTLRQFRGGSGKSGVPYTYTLTVTYFGRDWVGNESIKVVTNSQVQISCTKPEPTPTPEPTPSSAAGEPAPVPTPTPQPS